MDRIIRFFEGVGANVISMFTSIGIVVPLMPSVVALIVFVLTPERSDEWEELFFQFFLLGVTVVAHGVFYAVYAMFQSLRWWLKNEFELLPRICGIQLYLTGMYFSLAIPIAGIGIVGTHEWTLGIGVPLGIIGFLWFFKKTMQELIVFTNAETAVISVDTLDTRETKPHERDEEEEKRLGIPSQYRVHRSGRSFMMLQDRVDRSNGREPDVPLDLQTIAFPVEFETGLGPKVIIEMILHYYYDLTRPARLIRVKRGDAVKEGLQGFVKSALAPIMSSFNPTTGFNQKNLDNPDPKKLGYNQRIEEKLQGAGVAVNNFGTVTSKPTKVVKQVADTDTEKLYAIIIQAACGKISREKTHQDRLEIQEEYTRLSKTMPAKEALRAAQVNQKRITVAVNENISETKITGTGASGVIELLDQWFKGRGFAGSEKTEKPDKKEKK